MSDNAAIARCLRDNLRALSPRHLSLQDQSAAHRGHREAKNGAHFLLHIVSEQFHGLPLLRRHRLVYQALGDLAKLGVHALSVHAFTPQEYQHRKENSS